MNNEYKEYKKTATVMAKLFVSGCEDGFVHREGLMGAMEDFKYAIDTTDLIPFIKTLENPIYMGEFGDNYVCLGLMGERWLVRKDIFESTYVLNI